MDKANLTQYIFMCYVCWYMGLKLYISYLCNPFMLILKQGNF